MSIHFSDEMIWLNCITSFEQGQGRGTKAMQRLMDFARSEHLAIGLIPAADHPENQARLEAWYERLGFEWDSGKMIWHPET